MLKECGKKCPGKQRDKKMGMAAYLEKVSGLEGKEEEENRTCLKSHYLREINEKKIQITLVWRRSEEHADLRLINCRVMRELYFFFWKINSKCMYYLYLFY